MVVRRLHHAAQREVWSGNITPFASRKLLASLFLRLCLRTSRSAGAWRLATAAAIVAAAASTLEPWIFGTALCLALLVFLTSWRSLLPRKVFEDPATVQINRLPTHSRLQNYPTFEDAVARGQRSPNILSLSGTWKFLLVGAVSEAPKGFEDPGYSDTSWENIAVPGHWQLQDAGSTDPPIYTNTNYPFPNHPPYAPRRNPTGLYRRRFSVPAEWLEQEGGPAGGRVNGGSVRKVSDGRFSPIEGSAIARLKGRAVLVFQGVDSAFHVWVNGLLVGFAKGSRLPCEFDVTDALRGNGEQCLSLQVVRWSDGSYLEDQDHWWLSGVYREVELALRPAPARISDFVVRTFLREDWDGSYTRGSLEVEVLLEHDDTGQRQQPASPTSSFLPSARSGAGTAAAARPVATADGGGGSDGRRSRENSGTRFLDGDEEDLQMASFPMGGVEAGESGGVGFRKGPEAAAAAAAAATATVEEKEVEVEVECTLLDTATGQRLPLKYAGTLPDWQIGLPPGEEEEAQPQQRQQQQQQQQGLDEPQSEIDTAYVRELFSRCCSWFGLFARQRRRENRHNYAHYDHHHRGEGGGGGGETSAMLPPPAPTRRSVWLFRLEVPGEARAWSAEDPQLYTLVVSLEGGEQQEGTGGGGGGGGGGIIGSSSSHPPSFSSSSSFSSPHLFSGQFESARVGFRSVTVASRQLLVNGSAVMVAGVNRHEHDPDTGKTVSEESMRRDIVMMKRFNFNAVRNCHYPNHWRWYELCDELGLYVCDEANIETHGQIPLGRLSADPCWRLAYLDRVWRMVAANKNHACVVLWSLGNESGDGENFVACRRLVKEVDPSRPVMYEGGGNSLAEGCGCTELTDVVCPMYPTLETIEALGTDGPGGVGETRPCVLCEYSHAMGNSNGNLHKYWELFRKHRRLQGGFIWDWVDQGLTKHDPSSGRKYWADGGGFDGGHSAGYDAFCVNGVTFPDRSPHPALYEAKFLAQPVGIELLQDPRPPPSVTSASPGVRSDSTPASATAETETETETEAFSARLRFTNRYGFLSLEHLSVEWRLRSSAMAAAATGGADSSLAGGRLDIADVAPGESREVSVEASPDAAAAAADVGDGRQGGVAVDVGGEGGEIFLHVEARLAADTAWAPEGHLVAWGCIPVSGRLGLPPPRPPLPPPPPSTVTRSGAAPQAATGAGERVGGGGGAGRVASLETVLQTSPGFIAYEDSSASSSREESPLGQLRQHLLSDTPVPPPASSVIIMKGLLDRRGMVTGGGGAVDGGAAGGRHPFPREWIIAVNRVEGTVVRFQAAGVDLIQPGEGPSLCFWRAATDNDRAGWPTLLNFVVDHRVVGLLSKFLPLSRLSHAERWNASGLCASDPPVFETQGVRVERSSAQECIIKVKTSCTSRRGRTPLFNITTELRISGGGSLVMTTDVEPLKGVLRKSLSLARVGLLVKLPPGFGQVEWFGKGPFECYQDRKHGATTDVFSGKVEDQHVPYMVPSENGGRADVRWMALRRGEGGAGLLLQAESGMTFEAASVSLHSAAELHEAKRTVDLPARTSANDPVFVHLDHRSMGVGGDNSWYPNVVHEEYTVPANEAYRFRVRLKVLTPGAVAPTVAAFAPPPAPVSPAAAAGV